MANAITIEMPKPPIEENPTLLLELWLEENPTYTPPLGTRVLKQFMFVTSPRGTRVLKHLWVLKAQSFLHELHVPQPNQNLAFSFSGVQRLSTCVA
ncbi:hypothetical protein JHK84_036102 [Glycine max]|nr:hypothetical protein JHK85_036424 [Glycine max]KAG4976357.1 hypothetical protein JHK86_035831 [Glycine max]KAG5129705.1 hypothetical protein JHK84_036102 [Glycine max]